ncbi:MAG: DUF4956 domain-containing protein [Bacteroidota bacterium]|nr:DUF4956 domain-containing protein [Bacteroidota bacterium]
MFQDLDQIATLPITFSVVLENTIVALICGMLVAFFYRLCFGGRMYSPSFAHSLVLLSMITTVVIMVIGSNLARAFGLVGAMAIIRFRTAVKDMQDIIFIFFALAAGMAAGAGLTLIALTGTLAVGIVALTLRHVPQARKGRREYLLQFIYDGEGDGDPPYLPVLKKHCVSTRLLHVKAVEGGGAMELSFHVRLREENGGVKLLRDLRAIGSVHRVNLFFDEEFQ